MDSVEKNQLVVKIHRNDWIETNSQSLSSNAKEILLTINCYIYFSKIDPKDSYWSEINIDAFEKLTGLSSGEIQDAFEELIHKNILQQTDTIITFNRKAEYDVQNRKGVRHA